MTRSDLIIRFMSGIYGLTIGQAEVVVDWIEADRRRIEIEARRDEVARVPAEFINSPIHGNIWSKSQRMRELNDQRVRP